jgi:hypothetical protein
MESVDTQSLSSYKMERHTLPDGKMLGWNSGGLKRHVGGRLG